jgi:hypothetical protein
MQKNSNSFGPLDEKKLTDILLPTALFVEWFLGTGTKEYTCQKNCCQCEVGWTNE